MDRVTGHGATPIDLPVIVTERLRLRSFHPDDVDWVYELSLDPEMLRWVSLPVPYERNHAQFFVENIAIARAHNGTAANFVIENAATGQPLGRIGLHRKTDTAAEVGYWLAAHARGSGVMTEAVRTACRWGFSQEGMGLRRILWHALVGNVGSRKVTERAGFTIHSKSEIMFRRGQPSEKWSGVLIAPQSPDAPRLG
ncbi:GNAT family N-acetyltransferase [Streptomyces graminilatus]|uniref:GNAT family N-acetyltransferase n=1 Tax=Streptomyces graminilatus TaxID=1464070 RepID=UPI0007C7F424|nr:GNAT family N-acetyltransferase [Streptomyces graminilatus]